MLYKVLSEFPQPVQCLPHNVCISVTSWADLMNLLLLQQSGSGASVCMHVSKRSADTLNTDVSGRLA